MILNFAYILIINIQIFCYTARQITLLYRRSPSREASRVAEGGIDRKQLRPPRPQRKDRLQSKHIFLSSLFLFNIYTRAVTKQSLISCKCALNGRVT